MKPISSPEKPGIFNFSGRIILLVNLVNLPELVTLNRFTNTTKILGLICIEVDFKCSESKLHIGQNFRKFDLFHSDEIALTISMAGLVSIL